MRLILTLVASLLAGTAMAQTGTFGTSSGADGGAEPGLPGTGAGTGQEAGDTGVITDITELPPGAGDPGPDAGLDSGLDTGLDATGVITDITELPPGAGDAGLDAGLDVGLDAGLDDGFDTMDDGLSADGVDDTAAFPVLTAPGDGAEGTDGAPTVVEADGPVVVVPTDDGENEPAAAVNDPATRLTEGVDGDVQPKRIKVE